MSLFLLALSSAQECTPFFSDTLPTYTFEHMHPTKTLATTTSDASPTPFPTSVPTAQSSNVTVSTSSAPKPTPTPRPTPLPFESTSTEAGPTPFPTSVPTAQSSNVTESTSSAPKPTPTPRPTPLPTSTSFETTSASSGPTPFPTAMPTHSAEGTEGPGTPGTGSSGAQIKRNDAGEMDADFDDYFEVFSGASADKYCNRECLLSWIGDGICDRACFTESCCFDGGDCEAVHEGNTTDAGDAGAEGDVSCEDKTGNEVAVKLTMAMENDVADFSRENFVEELAARLEVPTEAITEIVINIDFSGSAQTVVEFNIATINGCYSAIEAALRLQVMLETSEEYAEYYDDNEFIRPGQATLLRADGEWNLQQVQDADGGAAACSASLVAATAAAVMAVAA